MPSDPIKTLLEESIAKKEFPSAVWLAAKGNRIVSRGAVGFARIEPETSAADTDTIYDLASLTKPLVTGLLTALLIERGEMNLSDAVGRFVPDFAREGKEGITIEDLLAHRSGLEAWRPFYLETSGGTRAERLEAVIARICELPLEYQPRTKVVYSDLNFILLGSIVEKVYGSDLSSAATNEIFLPLGLGRTFFNPPESFRSAIAASERGNVYERETARSTGFDVEGYEWRSGVILGEVHDGNCHYLGGIAGHAGLFSNAGDTYALAQQFLPSHTRLLRPESCVIFSEDLTKGLGQARSAAFQLASTKGSSARDALPASAFGHLGFTGTLLWIEPMSGSVFVLLTNRTHGSVPPFPDLAETRKSFLRTAFALTAS